MTYIKTGIDLPGILELLYYKESTGKALSTLAHTLLQGPSPLSTGERELIASYVSKLNNCDFCHNAHGAAANVLLDDPQGETISCVIEDIDESPVSEKMKALFNIAKKVQQNGKAVLPEDINRAKESGATDEELHDTVLIASAFCMFNRYVDGLNTSTAGPDQYTFMGGNLAKRGYKYPPKLLRKFIIGMMNKKGIRK